MREKTSVITVKEFVEKLAAGGGDNPSPADCVEYGLQCGWLNPQDAVAQDEGLKRKDAARIIHNFLRMELKEADETDGSTAYALLDLFDCRICAGPIIQVYVKGIMDGVTLPDGRMIFNADKKVLLFEAEEIVRKVFQRKVRVPRAGVDLYSTITKDVKELSPEGAIQLLKERERILLVDVRTEREYEENHMENAINVPLLSIIKNPFVLNENRDTMILLYCNEGYQSKAAAQCLVEAGYETVAFFAKKESLR